LITIRSSQTLFTLEEVARLTGLAADHIIGLARTRHLGQFVRAAEAAGQMAGQWLFTSSDLMILNVLNSHTQPQA